VETDEPADLVHAAAAGDPVAWRALVKRYSPLVWSVARGCRLDRADAEDVAQTTWEKFARSVRTIRDPEHVGGWLATTARREAIRVYESRKRTTAGGDLGWIGSDRIDETTPEDLVVDRQETEERAAYAQRAWRALRRLSAGCQELLRVLMADPAPTYAEAAAALDRPIGAIGPTRRRCLDRLRELMVEEHVSPESGAAHDR
jgi:RNA polymerase sigma factor (sigma-70 family)